MSRLMEIEIILVIPEGQCRGVQKSNALVYVHGAPG